jgi:hypothetical protein
MRTTLIMFAGLLVILTLLSSFGGTIKPREPFIGEIPNNIPFSTPEINMRTSQDVVHEERYEDDDDVEDFVESPEPVARDVEDFDAAEDFAAAEENEDYPEPFVQGGVMTEEFASV